MVTNKLLQEDSTRNAKSCFKLALREDEQGEAAFEFGSFLVEREEPKLGESYIHQAAEQGYHPALSFVLSAAFKTGDEKTYWLERALEHRLPEAFTADVMLKLEVNETEQSDESLKALRSALVSGQARRATAISFFQSYVDLVTNKVSDTQSAQKE